MGIDKKIIKKILLKFEKIEELMSELTPIDREKILEEFAEHYTLQHCVRFGIQCCDDILGV
jgi:hypothetical protein